MPNPLPLEFALSQIPARVRRGAAWLDAIRPHWRDTVNATTLDMAGCTRCIIGQIANTTTRGNYWRDDGLRAQLPGYSESDRATEVAHGLYAPSWPEDIDEYQADTDYYTAITLEWVKRLTTPCPETPCPETP